MLFYIVGKIADHTILEVGTRAPFNLTDLRSAYASNFGGVYTDYYIYSIEESNPLAIRALREDEYNVVWEDDAITGLDFTPEDTYRIMRFEPRDENEIVNDTLTANGVDYIDITASVWDCNVSAIDITFNNTILIPITNPDKKTAFVKTTFINGIATKRFKTLEYGIWNIPNGYKFKEDHIKITNEQILDINALMDI
jgi:hypothetical protein